MSDDGGTAFPRLRVQRIEGGQAAVHHEGGMSLRDYFAAHVISGLLADTGSFGPVEAPAIRASMSIDKIAAVSYQVADALLKARTPQ